MSKNTGDSNKKYKGFDENMFPESDEKLNVGMVKPFTRYVAAEMVLCLIAVVMGLLYLYTDKVTLDVLLPAFTIGMAAITVLRYLDGKACQRKGFIGNISVLFSALLTLLVAFVTFIYFRDTASETITAMHGMITRL